jgi:hypothetical protein
MPISEAEGEAGAGLSTLYLSVTRAYRDAYLAAACERDCWTESIETVQSIHPFLSKAEAGRLANRIVSQCFEWFPGWFSR